MIIAIDIRARAPFVDGAAFGDIGPYELLTGVARGELDPSAAGNRTIVNIDRTTRNARGRVEYRSDIAILRPVDAARGNGRLLYEVNNRGRKVIFGSLCGGRGGEPRTLQDCGTALPLRMGYSIVWSGWDAGAQRANGGLALDAPLALDGDRPLARPIREEFVPGTRRGPMATFRLSYEAATQAPDTARLTVRPRQTASRRPVAFEFVGAQEVRLLPEGTLPEPGAIYEMHYTAWKVPVLGIGFAAIRDAASCLRGEGAEQWLDRPMTHCLAIGNSQSGRLLRDFLVQGFNRDEAGRRVFDGMMTHVAGCGRVFLNEACAQPYRTRTWHEDRDFPELAFPFSTAMLADPAGGPPASLLRGDESDPLIVETNTSTEYWQKGASLIHTTPDGARDAMTPETVRSYFIAGTQHGGRNIMVREDGAFAHAYNWHDPSPAMRALFVALDEWVTQGRAPPASRVPRILEGTLVAAEKLAWPHMAGVAAPRASNDATPVSDWVVPVTAASPYRILVPQVGADGNELAGIRLPDIAVPRATHTGWNLYAAPFPAGELADREGSVVGFAATREAREKAGDPRPSLAELYTDDADYLAKVAAAVDGLLRARLLLPEDAAALNEKARARCARGGQAA